MIIEKNGTTYELAIPTPFSLETIAKKGYGLFAKQHFITGDRVIDLNGRLVDVLIASPKAVQIDEHTFLDTEFFTPDDFINHSCSPNTHIDLEMGCFIAIQPIAKGEEITFNYLTTEYDMKESNSDFPCLCGSLNCYGQINGFKYLSSAQKLKLEPFLSPFLLKKLSRRSSNLHVLPKVLRSDKKNNFLQK